MYISSGTAGRKKSDAAPSLKKASSQPTLHIPPAAPTSSPASSPSKHTDSITSSSSEAHSTSTLSIMTSKTMSKSLSTSSITTSSSSSSVNTTTSTTSTKPKAVRKSCVSAPRPALRRVAPQRLTLIKAAKTNIVHHPNPFAAK